MNDTPKSRLTGETHGSILKLKLNLKLKLPKQSELLKNLT